MPHPEPLVSRLRYVRLQRNTNTVPNACTHVNTGISRSFERWTSSRPRAFAAQNLVQTWLVDCWDDMGNMVYVFIAHTTPPSSSYMSLYDIIWYYIQGGLRRGRMPPALAPCMPVTTNEASRGRKCDSIAKGYIH